MLTRVPFLFVLLFAAPIFAGAVTLTLDGTAAYVRRHNPQLAAARLAIEEARGRLLGSGRLANPSLGFEFQNESRISPRTIGVSIDQSFPITGRLRLEKQLSAQLVTAAELEVRDAERRLIAEAQAVVVKYLALNQQRSLREKQAALAKQLSDFAKARAARGELSPLDAAQAQVDAQRTLLESRRTETERVGLLGELKAKLGLSAADSLAVEGALPPLTLPAAQSWQRRPDYQASRLRQESAQTGIALAKARKWQDMSAGLFTAQESIDSPTAARERTGFVGFRFSLPLPFWNRNEGEIAEKHATAERAVLESEALASAISNEAATARAEMAANAALAAETKDTLLPLITEQTDALEKAYHSGQTDLLTLLRAREQRLQMEAAALDAARDFHLARMRYEAAIGLHAPAQSRSAVSPGK